MRSLIAVLSLFIFAVPLQAATKGEKSLYDRLGGAFAIAAVVDHFSDALVENPIVGKASQNLALREWHTKNPRQVAGTQVHADPVGLRGDWRPVQILADKAGQNASGPRRGAS